MSSDSSGAPGPKESKEHKDKGIKKFWKKLTNQTNGSQMEEEAGVRRTQGRGQKDDQFHLCPGR